MLRTDTPMENIVLATAEDIPAWRVLAAEVEPLFGPMAGRVEFEAALTRKVAQGQAVFHYHPFAQENRMLHPDQRYLVIAGNIGVGKSTLVELLAHSLGWTPVPELDATPPYLDAYYADPQRWAFQLQIWFLTRRLAKHQQIATLAGTVVQDRSIYEDAAVFAASLHAQGILSAQDYATYQELYSAIARDLPPPDLVIYLRAAVPTLLQRIARRARPAERAITAAYLASLEQHYADWIATWSASPVLVIDTDELDSVQNPRDRSALIDHIVARWAALEARSTAG